MRSVGAFVASLVLVSTMAAPGHQQSIVAAQGAGKDPLAAAIVAVSDAYLKASLAGDAKAIAALYTDDATELPPNAPMIKGRAAIEQHYVREMGSGMKILSLSFTHLETHATGDTGYDVGTYQQSVMPKGASAPVQDTGKYVVIMKRSAGAWKVAYAIYNSDMPPPK
jgi:uncharacterized protein (TIGR02246 family)